MIKIFIKLIGIFMLGVGGIGIIIKYLLLDSVTKPGFIFFAWGEFSTDAISIALTILVLDALDSVQAGREEKKILKEKAIRMLSNPNAAITHDALRILRNEGWHKDGSLRYAYLRDANLAGADLSGADLSYADLSYANLENANLTGAKLDMTDLGMAKLEGAITRNSTINKAVTHQKHTSNQ